MCVCVGFSLCLGRGVVGWCAMGGLGRWVEGVGWCAMGGLGVDGADG